MDNPLVSCPFDKTHRVKITRLPKHIVKCQKNHPGFEACPFNATHRIRTSEFKEHVMNCSSRYDIFPMGVETVVADIRSPVPYLQSSYLPETDPSYEMWDEEKK